MMPSSAPNDRLTPSSTQKAVIKSWKTTAIGILLALSGFVTFSPDTFGGERTLLVQVCKFITMGGLAGLGITSKDFNVNGGNQQQ